MSLENLKQFEEPGEKPEQEKPQKGRVVCAWCKKELGEKEGLKEGEISHGICPDCRDKLLPRSDKKRE